MTSTPSPSFGWTTSPLKHATLLIIKVPPTTTTITKWMGASPWTSLSVKMLEEKRQKGFQCKHLIRVHLHVIFHGIHMSEPAPRLPCTSALMAKVFIMSNTKLQTKYYLEEILADGDPSIHSRKINSNSFPYHLEFNCDENFLTKSRTDSLGPSHQGEGNQN